MMLQVGSSVVGRPSGLMSGRALECFQHSKAVLLTTEDADAQGMARTSRLQPHRASSQGRLEWAPLRVPSRGRQG